MGNARIHLMTGTLLPSGAETTFCAKAGHEERGAAYEYRDGKDFLFCGTDTAAKVTCKRCLAAFNREVSPHGR